MPLCNPCSTISLDKLRDGCVHLNDAREIRNSAETCPLCHLIRIAFNKDTVKEIGNAYESRYYETVAEAPIMLYGVFAEHADNRQNDNEATDQGIEIVGIDVHVPLIGDDLDIANLGVYPEHPSSARGIIAGRPRLRTAESEEAMQVINTWMQKCISSHSRCRPTSLGNATALPTRVLDVSSDPVRLFVTQGQQAKYAALSHCWGKNPPLRTLTHNLNSHVLAIETGSLPKTFRDAVQITRALGLSYIWIDSLCIIQDDKNDWAREAVTMGNVYEGAEITIAATGSSNAYDGCFIARQNPPDAVPFRLYHSGGYLNVFAEMGPESATTDLQSNPLADRAWITQEWLLSRRTLHFGIGDVRWVCRTMGETETGETFMDTSGTQRIHDAIDSLTKAKYNCLDDLQNEQSHEFTDTSPESDFLEEWLDVSSGYCRRKLTYPSDKPIALKGIIDVIARRINKKCFYGVWEFSIHRQLFWFASNTLTRPVELASLPTWSWLSTYGRIHHLGQAPSSELLRSSTSSEVVSLHIDGTRLHIHAPSFEYTRIAGPFSLHIPEGEKEYTSSTIQNVRTFQGYINTYMSGGNLEFSRAESQHFFGIHGESDAAIGWVSLDTDNLPRQNVSCVAISRNSQIHGGQANFLVLHKKNDSENVWRRIGMGELKDDFRSDTMWSFFQVE